MPEMIDGAKDAILLHNRFFSKRLRWNENGLFSDSLVNLKTGSEYCKGRGYEFSFAVNGRKIISYSEPMLHEADGNAKRHEAVPRFLDSAVRRIGEAEELSLRFSRDDCGVVVKITYRISPEIPGVVKQLEIEALKDDLCITELIFDTFNFYPGRFRDCNYFCGSDDVPLPLNFAVEGTTDIIRCHNAALKEGFLCGSAAPGPLRRFMGYIHWNSMDVTYSMGNAPFTKYLRKGETFCVDHSFLLLYAGNTATAGESDFRRLLRTVLPPASEPGVMYCTWLPFLNQIHEKLVLDLAERAARIGCRYFVLDDGWFTSEERHVDVKKFPRGLEFLSKKIRDMGLYFGLWYNIGTSYGAPNTPDALACRLSDGGLKKSGENKVLCFASEHRQTVLKDLTVLAKRYHVTYFKLDFSSILSPYAVLPHGCHSREHRYHRGYEDSVIEMYRGFLFLRNELKKRIPGLIVDFSFESFGTGRPNIAALEFSDLHHISNFSGREGEADITKIRKQFYRWFGKLPPERILGGLLVLQNDLAAEHLLTSFAGAPLVSGDLRKLPETTAERIGKFTEAFYALADKEILTELEVVLDESDLDAFIRRGKSGHGFLCAFNRKKEEVTLKIPTPFVCRNVETRETGQHLPPNSCGMFIF